MTHDKIVWQLHLPQNQIDPCQDLIMKILIWAEQFYPLVGGVETSTRLIGDGLTRMGAVVRLMTLTPFDQEEPFNFPVIRHPDKQTMKQEVHAADIVYMNGFYAPLVILTKLYRKKLVFCYRDLTMVCPLGTRWTGTDACTKPVKMTNCIPCLKNNGQNKLFRRYLRPTIKSLLSHFADANVCTSEYGMKYFPLTRKTKIENAVDTRFFIKHDREMANDVVRVIFVGRLIPDKGCQLIIESLARLIKQNLLFELVICGTGPYEKDLKALARNLGLDKYVSFAGNQTGKNLLQQFHNSDIAIVPSIIDEPFGLTAIEAMSCGLPVIASAVGGLQYIVKDVGLLFKRNSVEDLAEKIGYLIQNPHIRHQMGDASREVAMAKYDYDHLSRNYFQLFEKLLNQH